VEDFVKRASSPEGYRNECKSCTRKNSANVWVNNRDKYNSQRRAKRLPLSLINTEKKKAEKTEAFNSALDLYNKSKLLLNKNESGRTKSECQSCHLILPPEMFSKCKTMKSGCHGYCKKCDSEKGRIKYAKQRVKIIEDRRAYRDSNKELIKAQRRTRYEKLKANPVAWSAFMQSSLNYINKKLRTDVSFRLLAAARNRLYYVVKGTAKAGRTIELLGCTPEELKTHLEKQFKPGWTWADWGPVFEIDHIIPCSKFDMTNPEQQKSCFHYTNLQPLLKQENRSKWNKIIAA